jgi:3-dehydroquinate dehydratase
VVNAGAFSHYAYAITDALATVRRPEDRSASVEPVRARTLAAPSVIAPVVDGAIVGFEGNRLPPRVEAGRNIDRGAKK